MKGMRAIIPYSIPVHLVVSHIIYQLVLNITKYYIYLVFENFFQNISV